MRSAAGGEFDVALTGSDRSLHTLASLKAKGHRFKLVYWIPFTIPFVDMFDPRSLAIRQAAFPQVDLFVAITDTCRRVLLLEGIPEVEEVSAVSGQHDYMIFLRCDSNEKLDALLHDPQQPAATPGAAPPPVPGAQGAPLQWRDAQGRPVPECRVMGGC